MQKQNKSAFLFRPCADTRATCLAENITVSIRAAFQASSRKKVPFKAPK